MNHKLQPNQRKLLKYVIPHYDPTIESDVKKLKIIERVLQWGVYKDDDKSFLNILRKGYLSGAFEPGISQDEVVHRLTSYVESKPFEK